MVERVLKCPQCNAPLAPSRFAASTVCPYCGSTVVIDEQVVSAERFRKAYRAWSSPSHHGYTEWLTIDDSHWAPGSLVARGEISDVYFAQRARWPTERVLLKILRDPRHRPRFDNEWEVLQTLHRSDAPGAATLSPRLPQPVVCGPIRSGAHSGRRAMALLWKDGFVHTFEAVRQAYPGGIEPRASIWIWRRILEVLSFLHASGFVHGAVLPPHLLVEDNEHGVLVVGFGCAGPPGAPLSAVCTGCKPYYPADLLALRKLTPAVDLAMSARSVAVLLGGDPAGGEVPARVPAPLAALVRDVARQKTENTPRRDAWALRERLGELARELFGSPAFCPIVMSR